MSVGKEVEVNLLVNLLQKRIDPKEDGVLVLDLELELDVDV